MLLPAQISGIANMKDFLFRFGTVTTTQPDPTNLRSTICEGATMCKALNPWLDGLIVSFMSIGTMIGAMAGAYLADYFGRRRAMQYEVGIFFIGVIVQLCTFWSWAEFAVGRLIAGLGIGALSCAVPVYQAECLPRQLRGTLVATYQWAITAGILIAYCFDIATRCAGSCDWKEIYGTTYPIQTRHTSHAAQWRVPVGLGMFFGAFLAIAIQFCPESPRWLALHGRYDEAREAVARVRGKTAAERDPYVEAEFAEIVEAAQEEKTNKATWIETFRPENKTLYRTLLGMTLQMGQQLTGANYFFYYGTQIMVPVGVTDPFVTQIIFGAVNFVCTLFGLYMLEAVGRRLPLIFGGVWCSAWLIVFATAGVAGNKADPDTGIKKLGDPHLGSGIGKLMICSGCFFILGYASTWAPGIWLFTGEVFDSRTRARQASLATLSNWVWNFLLAFFTTPITADIGFAYGYIFAGCNAVNAIIAYFFVYETKDLNLEQVNAMYCDPNCHAWTSRPWVPAGMASRDDIKGEIERQHHVALATTTSKGAGTADEEESGKGADLPVHAAGATWHDDGADYGQVHPHAAATGDAEKPPEELKMHEATVTRTTSA